MAGERELGVTAAADSPNIVGFIDSGMHMNERMVVASRSWQRPENGFSSKVSRKKGSPINTDFSSVSPISYSDLQKCKIINVLS